MISGGAAFDATGQGKRFRSQSDWFIVSTLERDVGKVYVAQVGTTGERAVDLMHGLAFHLDPAVDVVIDSARDRKAWEGHLLALPDVRDAIGRLKLTLATYGGVELSLYTPDDQLSLSPELALVVYSRTDRWLYLLEGMGLEERTVAPPPVWHPSRDRIAPAPELAESIRAAVERLALVQVTSSYKVNV